MLYLIPTIDFDLSLVKDNAAYGVSLLILQINQVFSITENYGANLTVLGLLVFIKDCTLYPVPASYSSCPSSHLNKCLETPAADYSFD